MILQFSSITVRLPSVHPSSISTSPDLVNDRLLVQIPRRPKARRIHCPRPHSHIWVSRIRDRAQRVSNAIVRRKNRTLRIHVWSETDVLTPIRNVVTQTAGALLPVAGSAPVGLRADKGPCVDAGGVGGSAADCEVLGRSHVGDHGGGGGCGGDVVWAGRAGVDIDVVDSA